MTPNSPAVVANPAAPRTLPRPSDLARHWPLDPSIVFLNHGSFGSCPREVLAVQARLRDRLESEPVRFFVEDLAPLMDAARRELAAFVRCDAGGLAFLPNATTAVATVLANIESRGFLKAGDEIIGPEHEYPACMNNLRRLAALTGAVIVRPEIPFPARSPDHIADAVLAKVTPRTRLALISHVTSPSGMILPVERLVAEFERRGILTIVDAAHCVGMLDLNLAAINAPFYTSNCHKWLCTPKGSAFLHVREDHREVGGGFRPMILSNSAEKPKPGRAHYLTEFDYIGTDDPTACLAIPDAIRFLASLVPGGWPEIRRRNHDLAIRGRDAICRAVGIQPPAPDAMLGSLSTMILPELDPALKARLSKRPTRFHDALQDALMERHKIQVPVWGIPDKPGAARFIRISAQLYNSPEQYDYLAGALSEELDRERKM